MYNILSKMTLGMPLVGILVGLPLGMPFHSNPKSKFKFYVEERKWEVEVPMAILTLTVADGRAEQHFDWHAKSA